MEKIISCCGVVCSDCDYYPEDCGGCPAIEGKPFWLHYTGGDICNIYRCCILEKKLDHCGKCGKLPCSYYEEGDPTRAPEENREILKSQLEVLASLE